MTEREKFIETIRKSFCGVVMSYTAKALAERAADALISEGAMFPGAKIGEKVFCIAQPCGGCPCYNEPMKEEFIEMCRKCDKYEVIECDFDYDLIPEFGKTVFNDREAAVKVLEEKRNESI